MAPPHKRWIPLESNPDLLNEFADKLGCRLQDHGAAFCDVFGLDPELLCMVPEGPVHAVIMLFPITPESEAARRAEQAELEAAGGGPQMPPGLYYMKQTIGNACGTIALLHCLGNNRDSLPPRPGSFLDQFFRATEMLSPAERGHYLEHPPEGAPNIDSIHEEAARQGATAAPDPEEDVDLHFVALVHRGGRLVELDGRKAQAVDCGPSSASSLLADAAAVIRQKYVEGSGSLQFTVMALATAE